MRQEAENNFSAFEGERERPNLLCVYFLFSIFYFYLLLFFFNGLDFFDFLSMPVPTDILEARPGPS